MERVCMSETRSTDKGERIIVYKLDDEEEYNKLENMRVEDILESLGYRASWGIGANHFYDGVLTYCHFIVTETIYFNV